MPFTSKTYTVGTTGGVRRLDNLTAPWVNIPLSSTIVSPSVGDLVDVEADPNNGNHVYVVGAVDCFGILPVYYGVAVSNDAGLTWQVPTGNYQNAVTDSECDYTWYEVCVVDSSNAFICGARNTTTNKPVVAKTSDGGASFVQTAAFPAAVNGMDATSIHFISPLIGVVGFNDIACKTTDGGATWTVCNGGSTFSPSYPMGQITGIFLSQAQDNMMVVGLSRVLRAADPAPNAGMINGSWGPTVSANNNSFIHLSRFDDQTIFVSGLLDSIVNTQDGGGSWSACPYALPGGLPSIGPDRRAAHWYRFNPSGPWHEGFISSNANIELTFQGHCVPPPPDPNNELSPYGVSAVWTWYQTIPPAPRCYLLTNCETLTTIVVSNNLASSVGQVVSLVEYPGCWTVSIAQNCTGSVVVTVVTTSATCVECIGTCYLLVPCDPLGVNILTNTNLAAQLGMVITIQGSTQCYVVNTSPGCNGAIPVVLVQTYATCIDCHPTCYLLTDCETGNQIITSQDLSAYVQQVIKLQNCPDKCWTVDTVPDCTGSVPTIPPILSVHIACDDCLGVLPPEPLKLRPRRIKPGYDTPGCPPAYTEKVSCNFADQTWDYMASIRYGINSCCEADLDKWTIKKQILDLKAIFDPELCKNAICECPEPCDVTAVIEVPYAAVCPAPTNVTSQLDIPAPCNDPTDVTSVLIIP